MAHDWRTGQAVLTEAGRVAEVTRFARARDASGRWADAAYVRYAAEQDESPLFEFIGGMEKLVPSLRPSTVCTFCPHDLRSHEDWLGYRGHCRTCGIDLCSDFGWWQYQSAEQAESDICAYA
jgi:hypothetical protein